MTEQMRAVFVTGTDGPDSVQVRDVDRPAPIPTEVLVRVTAAGINPVDLKTAQGQGMAAIVGAPPYRAGWDLAGTVADANGSSRFHDGDRVLGLPWFPRPAGTWAEYVAVPARQLWTAPAALDDAAAGALPLAGLIAWQALVDLADVRPGQRVLVHAAGGGVGHLAVQVAVARGAVVAGTASAPKHERLRKLGVTEMVDYVHQEFEKVLDPVDVVLDLTGGYGERSLDVLKPGGLLISVPSGAGGELVGQAERRGLRATGILVEPDEIGLAALAEYADEGRLVVDIEQTWPLEQAADALRHLAAGGVAGKLALTL